MRVQLGQGCLGVLRGRRLGREVPVDEAEDRVGRAGRVGRRLVQLCSERVVSRGRQ